jgi:hypothetical protein
MLIHGATDNDIHPPLFGASQRTFGLYRGLARRHEVRVLCVVPNRSPGAREERAAGVALVRRKAWYTSLTWRAEQMRLLPHFLAAYAHRARATALLEALPGRPDVRAADLTVAGLLESGGGALTVYTSHNVEVDHFRMVKAEVLGLGFWARRLRTLEARAVDRADLTVVCSDEDAARMSELHGARAERLTVIPHGFDETRVTAPEPAARARARLALGVADAEYLCMFLGSDTPFNRQGLARLTGAVLPALAPHGFRLLVVGGIAAALRGRREPWLIVRGATGEITPFLNAADAGLNPVTTGGGSNVKLPTYLGAGLAVVTTPFGLRGYVPLAPWVVAAPPERFAEALRERPAGWRAGGALRPEAIEDYAWGRLGERLGCELERRLGRGGTGSAPRPAREAGGMGA